MSRRDELERQSWITGFLYGMGTGSAVWLLVLTIVPLILGGER